MGVETTRAEAWLYQTLTGDAALAGIVGARVYSHVAPEGAEMPFIVYQQQAGSDLFTTDSTRVWSSLLYIVKALGRSVSWNAVEAAVERIDSLLHGVTGAVGPGQVYRSYRERPFSLVEVNDGVQYRHLGGYYRLLVQPG